MTPEFEADVRSKINPSYRNWPGTESYERAIMLAEIDRLREAIRKTLNDNAHLADGDNCTLLVLKLALPDWEMSE
jgi:hypothetical protein